MNKSRNRGAEARKIISELEERYSVPLEAIATRMGLSYYTIRSWVYSSRNPTGFGIEKLKQILHGHQSQAKKKM